MTYLYSYLDVNNNVIDVVLKGGYQVRMDNLGRVLNTQG